MNNNQLSDNQNILSRTNVAVQDDSFAGKNFFNSGDDSIPIREMITDITILEPTPINPNGVRSVHALSLESTASSHADRDFLESLRNILDKDDANSFHGNIPFGVKSQFVQSSDVQDSFSRMYNQNNDSMESIQSMPVVDGSFDSTSSISGPLRSSQQELWSMRYQELVEFKNKFQHCLVPLHWPSNPSLAHWVKRQRNQYRAKQLGRHSTLTPEREQALESLGFVWDSHAAIWEERWKELRDFHGTYGHCRVPKKYPRNQQLAFWVKCQRRQFKLYCAGSDSNMTPERIEKLLSIGFEFAPRLCQGRK